MEMTYEEMLREMEAYYAASTPAPVQEHTLTPHEEMQQRFCAAEDDDLLAALRKQFAAEEVTLWLRCPAAAAGIAPITAAELEAACAQNGREVRRILEKLLDKKVLLHVDNKMGCGYFARCDRHTVQQLKAAVQKSTAHAPTGCAVQVAAGACVGCRLCEKACPVRAIRVEGKIVLIQGKACMGCGACVRKCPKKALRMGMA